MIEFTCTATIRDVKLSAKVKDGITTRKIKMTLEREYDDFLAASLGSDAIAARKLLKSGGLEKATIPLDAVRASATLRNFEGTRVAVPLICGVKAEGKAPDTIGDEVPPSIKMQFEFVYSREALLFFGESLGMSAEITLVPQQLELLKDPPASSGRSAVERAVDEFKRSIPAGTRVAITAGGEKAELVGTGPGRPIGDGAAVESDDDRAHAASPEDAEAARASRLAAEKADQRAAEGERYAPEIIAAADDAEAGFTFTDCEEDAGPYVLAKFESPTHVMEADGDDRTDARLNLRLKLLEQLTTDALAGAPKVGLQVPAGAKPKTHKSTRKG